MKAAGAFLGLRGNDANATTYDDIAPAEKKKGRRLGERQPLGSRYRPALGKGDGELAAST